jgi:hypothetical protein
VRLFALTNSSSSAVGGPKKNGRVCSLATKIFGSRAIACGICERSVGTVFQLPNPDAIYSRDKKKERKVGPHLMFVFAHGPRAAEAR